MNENTKDKEYQEIVNQILQCYFSSGGGKYYERFRDDPTYAELITNAAQESIAVIACAFTNDDESFMKMAFGTVQAPWDDPDEVALLRIFAIDNMVTAEMLERPGSAGRLNWFKKAYLAARGKELPLFSNGH